jgi:hypothetical protein
LGLIGKDIVNPLSLSGEVGVLATHDDSGMLAVLLMQADEVAPVDGHHRTILSDGKAQHV